MTVVRFAVMPCMSSGMLGPGPARAREGQGGFTAVEALVALLILALAAALLTVGVRRWVMHARTAEAVAMLAEISSKQQAFLAGGGPQGQYLPLRADNNVNMPSADEAAAAFYPLPADSERLQSARTPTLVDDASRWPTAWKTIGLRPRGAHLYCTYLANAGRAGQPVPPNLRFGAALLAGAPPGPWFYALAACNLDGDAGYPDQVTIYGVSSASGTVQTFNEGH